MVSVVYGRGRLSIWTVASRRGDCHGPSQPWVAQGSGRGGPAYPRPPR